MDSKLHTAVRFGNFNAVLEALRSGLNPNEIGLFKWSPVHEAANNGERDILKLLVAYKGNVNLQDNLHGNTPLHYAAREDNSACVTVLLKAGARIDIKNYEGMTCQDESTPLCREIIRDFVNSRNVGSEWTGEKNERSPNKKINGNPSQNEGDSMPSVPEQAAIGQVHLSFEYHKMTLKIKVWQVSDLLLPPPQISMIDSIFVRSYLIPDTVKKTNRQTEAVRVDSQSKDSTLPPQTGIQHIFSSSSFRFETPLMYTGVTQDIIAERSVQLEVCMTQKYSHKAFLMAMVHMPLRTAVKHPIREKYPLIPCMNYTIPNNMRVYSARDIIFDKSQFFLGESPTRSNSVQSGFSCPTKDVYSEDSDLESFIHRTFQELTDSDCDDDDVGSSFDIKSSLGKSRITSAGIVDVISLSTDNEDTPKGFGNVVDLHNKVPNNVTTDVGVKENPKPKRKIIPNELLDNSPSEPKSNYINISKDDSESVAEHDPSVVKILASQSYGALDLESQTTKEADKNELILNNPPNGKKKIIPPELRSSAESTKLQKPPVNQNSNQGDDSGDYGDLYDDITSDDKNTTVTKPSICVHPDMKEPCIIEEMESIEGEVCDVTSKVNQSQQSAVFDVSDTGPSSATASRPETPIWDFYDFSLEEGAEHLGVGDEPETGSCKDEASLALGTLQESILRLSRTSQALDTCRVTGPILPAVLIEDFEMDADDDVDENDNDDDVEDDNDCAVNS